MVRLSVKARERVECEYRSYSLKSGTVPLGYYYRFKFHDESAAGSAADTPRCIPLLRQQAEGEFVYYPAINSYCYAPIFKEEVDSESSMSRKHGKGSLVEALMSKSTRELKGIERLNSIREVFRREASMAAALEKDNGKEKKKEVLDLPEFYMRIRPAVEKICNELGDWDLLKTVPNRS